MMSQELINDVNDQWSKMTVVGHSFSGWTD